MLAIFARDSWDIYVIVSVMSGIKTHVLVLGVKWADGSTSGKL